MPELPDIVVYIEALGSLIQGRAIERIHLKSPFFLRSVEPGLKEAEEKKVLGFLRLGKRVVWVLEDDLFLVFHLMIAGRFHWKETRQIPRKKTDLIAFHFPNGTLMVTEAGSKKKAHPRMVWLAPTSCGIMVVIRSPLPPDAGSACHERHGALHAASRDSSSLVCSGSAVQRLA